MKLTRLLVKVASPQLLKTQLDTQHIEILTFTTMLHTHAHATMQKKNLIYIYENDISFVQDRTALLFLLFPSMLLILRSWIWAGCLPAFPVQMYQVCSFRPLLFAVILVFTCLYDEIFVSNLSLSIIICHHQAWLLFLYTGLALRENILRVNGSDIRPWYSH